MFILLFDIDGTLINSGGAGGAALCAALEEEFNVDRAEKVRFSGRTDRGIGSDLLRLHGIEDSPENWQRLRDGYLRRLPEYLPQRPGRILPGVSELLGELGSVPRTVMGLLTGNLRTGAEIKLQHFGLNDYFSFGGFGDEHPHRDDVAHSALAAARDALPQQAADEQIWVFGDTPLDIQCARAINARVVAVATGVEPRDELEQAGPDVLLDDLSDTQRVLEIVFGTRTNHRND